jgi:hypothetical protein
MENRTISDGEKADIYVKIAETFLAEDEAVDAEAFVNRASSLMEVSEQASKRASKQASEGARGRTQTPPVLRCPPFLLSPLPSPCPLSTPHPHPHANYTPAARSGRR